MNINYYTGVGSRNTPDSVCNYMAELARIFAMRNYVLRSGHAPGADMAFETGVDDYARKSGLDPESLKEIWSPWKGFNGCKSLNFPSQQAYELSSKIHPAWNRLKDSHKALHARNAHQVLGKCLTDASKFLICWTQDGEPVGGTRTAIVIAKQNNVPVLNLGKWKSVNSMREATIDFLMLIGEEYEI